MLRTGENRNFNENPKKPYTPKPSLLASHSPFEQAGPSRVVFVGLGAAEADARAAGAAAAGAVKGLKGAPETWKCSRE